MADTDGDVIRALSQPPRNDADCAHLIKKTASGRPHCYVQEETFVWKVGKWFVVHGGNVTMAGFQPLLSVYADRAPLPNAVGEPNAERKYLEVERL